AELEQVGRLDDLDMAPEMAGVVAEVAEPAAAGPGLELHVHGGAVGVGEAGADLVEDGLEGGLGRRGDLDLADDAQGLDGLFDGDGRHGHPSLWVCGLAAWG